MWHIDFEILDGCVSPHVFLGDVVHRSWGVIGGMTDRSDGPIPLAQVFDLANFEEVDALCDALGAKVEHAKQHSERMWRELPRTDHWVKVAKDATSTEELAQVARDMVAAYTACEQASSDEKAVRVDAREALTRYEGLKYARDSLFRALIKARSLRPTRSHIVVYINNPGQIDQDNKPIPNTYGDFGVIVQSSPKQGIFMEGAEYALQCGATRTHMAAWDTAIKDDCKFDGHWHEVALTKDEIKKLTKAACEWGDVE